MINNNFFNCQLILPASVTAITFPCSQLSGLSLHYNPNPPQMSRREQNGLVIMMKKVTRSLWSYRYFFFKFNIYVFCIPNVGLELTTSRSKLTCSTNQASQAPPYRYSSCSMRSFGFVKSCLKLLSKKSKTLWCN